MLKKFDHLAIIVADTEEALKFYHERLGLQLLFSEVLEDQGVRLTHLDMGAGHLQLVQPLRDDHPLQDYLEDHGEGLHHVCFYVRSVPEMISELPDHGLKSRDSVPRSGPNGRQAAFIDPDTTRGVLIEITGEPDSEAADAN